MRSLTPATGRYLQSDPIGLAGGSLSTYGYALNNPANLVDQWGLASGSITFGGNALYGNSGGTLDFGLGADTSGNICIVSTLFIPVPQATIRQGRNSTSIGTVGGILGLGGSISIDKENFCEGYSTSRFQSTLVDGGVGDIGGISGTTDSQGALTGFGKAFGGIGIGAGFTRLNCQTSSYCVNPIAKLTP